MCQCLCLLGPQSPSTCPSSWWAASSSPSWWSVPWWLSTAAPACGPSSRPSSLFASPCAAARARPSPWSSPRRRRASAPRRDSPARPPPAQVLPEAAAPCAGFPSEVRGSNTAVWCRRLSPRQPPPPPRLLRLYLHLPHPLTSPSQCPCQEASSTPSPPATPTPSCSSTRPLTPRRAPASSCLSNTFSRCSLTPSQQLRALPTSDRADRAPRRGTEGLQDLEMVGCEAAQTKQHIWWRLGWKARAGWQRRATAGREIKHCKAALAWGVSPAATQDDAAQQTCQGKLQIWTLCTFHHVVSRIFWTIFFFFFLRAVF